MKVENIIHFKDKTSNKNLILGTTTEDKNGQSAHFSYVEFKKYVMEYLTQHYTVKKKDLEHISDALIIAASGSVKLMFTSLKKNPEQLVRINVVTLEYKDTDALYGLAVNGDNYYRPFNKETAIANLKKSPNDAN